jgi:MoxR-like ATPase
LTGPPGVGKNQLVYALARAERRPLYIVQGHEEVQPEDLACCARLTDRNRVQYVGSPLLAAMIRGGICFFDEIGKVPPRSLSVLASVLDDRRSLTSVLAGFTVTAHPEFRFCAAMNDTDASVHGLPSFIDERLRPCFAVDYPGIEHLMQIVAMRFPAASTTWLHALREQVAADRSASPREAIAIFAYALKLRQEQPGDDSSAHAGRLMARAAAACATGPGGSK